MSGSTNTLCSEKVGAGLAGNSASSIGADPRDKMRVQAEEAEAVARAAAVARSAREAAEQKAAARRAKKQRQNEQQLQREVKRRQEELKQVRRKTQLVDLQFLRLATVFCRGCLGGDGCHRRSAQGRKPNIVVISCAPASVKRLGGELRLR